MSQAPNEYENEEEFLIHKGQYDEISPEARQKLEDEFPGITSTNLSPYEFVHNGPGGNDFDRMKKPGCYPIILLFITTILYHLLA